MKLPQLYLFNVSLVLTLREIGTYLFKDLMFSLIRIFFAAYWRWTISLVPRERAASDCFDSGFMLL